MFFETRAYCTLAHVDHQNYRTAKDTAFLPDVYHTAPPAGLACINLFFQNIRTKKAKDWSRNISHPQVLHQSQILIGLSICAFLVKTHPKEISTAPFESYQPLSVCFSLVGLSSWTVSGTMTGCVFSRFLTYRSNFFSCSLFPSILVPLDSFSFLQQSPASQSWERLHRTRYWVAHLQQAALSRSVNEKKNLTATIGFSWLFAVKKWRKRQVW